MQDHKKKIVKSISSFSLARLTSEVFFFFRGLLLAKIMGPALFGVWTEMKLALIFLPLCSLGVNEAMLREAPYAKGKNNLQLAEKIKGVSGCFNLVSALFVSLCIVFFSISLGGRTATDYQHQTLWCFFALIFFIHQMYLFTNVTLQVEKRFQRLGRMIIAFAACSCVLGGMGTWLWGLPGFLVVLCFSYGAVFLYGTAWLAAFPSPRWDSGLLKELLRKGLPIMLSGAFFILLFNVDKIIIRLLMSKGDLGVYAVQSYIINVVLIVPASVVTVIYPRLLEGFGRTNDLALLERYLHGPTLTLAYLACPLLGIFSLALHLPLKWLLPKYISAIEPGQILIMAVYFIIVSRVASALLISLKKQNLLLVITAVSVSVGIAADLLFLKHNFGLTAIALGTSLSFVFYATAVLCFSFSSLQMSLKNSLSFLFLLFVPFVAVLGATGVLHFMLNSMVVGARSDLLYTGLSCLITLLIMAVVYSVVHKRTGLLERMAIHGL